MLDPAWDFGLDRAWQGHIALMRGVEDGFNIVHAARDGWVIGSHGRRWRRWPGCSCGLVQLPVRELRSPERVLEKGERID